MSILKGKTALVTGAKGGLGSAVYKELFPICKTVFRTDFKNHNLSSIRDLDRICLLWPHVDILINCAGIYVDDLPRGDFDRCMAVNVRAPYLLSRCYSEYMVKRGWGRIVNIASAAGYRGTAGKAIYCASKHALVGLSRSLSEELRPHGVRVYCVSPEAMQTDMGRTLKDSGPFETFIKPESVAKFIVFLIGQDDEMICDEVRLNRVLRDKPAKLK